MALEIGKFIRIQNPVAKTRGSATLEWRIIPNCDRVAIWEVTTVETIAETTGKALRQFVFHIPHMEGVTRGSRVTYLGGTFDVIRTSDSAKLRGLELLCDPI